MVLLKSHSLTSVNGRSTQQRTLKEIILGHVPQEPHSQMKNDKNQNIYGIYLTTKPGNNPKIFNKQVEKQAVLFPYCGILLSSIKESTDTDHTDDLTCIMPSERSQTQNNNNKKTCRPIFSYGLHVQKQRFRNIKPSLERLGSTFKGPSCRANTSQEKTIYKNQGKIQVKQSLSLPP